MVGKRREKVAGAYGAMLGGEFAPADFRIEDLAGTGLVPKRGSFEHGVPSRLTEGRRHALCSSAKEKAARKEAAKFVTRSLGHLASDGE